MEDTFKEQQEQRKMNNIAAGVKAELFIHDHLKDVNSYSDEQKIQLARAISEILNIPVPPGLPLPIGGLGTLDDVAVFVTDSGSMGISFVKEIKDITGMGLKDAKDFWDDTKFGEPIMLIDGLTYEDASKIVERLEGVGAKAKLQFIGGEYDAEDCNFDELDEPLPYT